MNKIPEFNFNGHSLDKDNTSLLLRMLMMKEKEVPLENEPELSRCFPAEIILKRIEVYKLPFKISSFFFVFTISAFPISTPGDCMMVLWLCNQYYKKTGKTFLGIDDFCYIFPNGCPTDNEKEEWWDSQKIPYEHRKPGRMMTDNMVDIAELWK